jgi:hypothetical protein
VLLLLPFARAADCASSRPEVEADLAAAESAWGVDEAAFRKAAERAHQSGACLRDVADTRLAARIHRVEGLSAFLAGDKTRAGAAFAAARSADPEGAFPDAMIPPGNPVRVLWDANAPRAGSVAAPRPARGELAFDGTIRRDRPTGQATYLQRIEGGAAAQSAWLAPEDPLPSYRQQGEGLRLPLLLAAGAAAAGGGVLYALALDQRSNPPEPTGADVLTAWQRENHALVLGGAALGGVAVGAGAAALVYGRW